MLTSKLELLVDFGPKPYENILNKTLTVLRSQDGVVSAAFKDGAIVVETTLPSSVVVDLVSNTSGKRTVLQGFGETYSAVAMLSSQSCCGRQVMGVVRLQQSEDGPLVAEGAIDGLTGRHGLHVRESGDLSKGCRSLGEHYNPTRTLHGGPADPPDRRHAGDLGNIVADENGRATFRIVDNVLKIWDIVGRSIAVTESVDDLGKGDGPNSKLDGNSGQPIACGIIARAAGVFQNPKRICACDGVVVWDERERPLAGKGRRQPAPCCQKETEEVAAPCCQKETQAERLGKGCC